MTTTVAVLFHRTLALVAVCSVVTVVAVVTSDDAPVGLASALALVLIAAGVIWAIADRDALTVRSWAQRALVPLSIGAGFVTVLAVVPDDATSRPVRLVIIGGIALAVVGVAAGVSLTLGLLMRAKSRQ